MFPPRGWIMQSIMDWSPRLHLSTALKLYPCGVKVWREAFRVSNYAAPTSTFPQRHQQECVGIIIPSPRSHFLPAVRRGSECLSAGLRFGYYQRKHHFLKIHITTGRRSEASIQSCIIAHSWMKEAEAAVHYSPQNGGRKFRVRWVDVGSQLGLLQSCNKMISLFFPFFWIITTVYDF